MRDIDKAIRSASVQDLERELKTPCGGDRRHWRHSPHPLYRAAQLGRIDLMEKWIEWGCSLRGTHGIPLYGRESKSVDPYDTRAIVAVLFEMNSNLITLVGDCKPYLLEGIFNEIVRYDSKHLNNLDLFRGLTQMRTNKIDTTELVSNMIVIAIGSGDGPLKQLLEFNNGVIAPSENWRGAFSTNGYHIAPERFKDADAYKRVNALPSDLIASVDATVLLEMGLAVTIYSLKMHMDLMERSDQFKVRRKKTNWDVLQSSFNRQWRSGAFNENEWTAIFDCLLNDVVDIRSTGGYSRSTIYSFIQRVALPETVLTALAVRAWEASPTLMHLPMQKTIGANTNQAARSFIQSTENSHGALLNIRSTLMSLESHGRLQRVMQTQTKKVKEPVVVHKRRM